MDTVEKAEVLNAGDDVESPACASCASNPRNRATSAQSPSRRRVPSVSAIDLVKRPNGPPMPVFKVLMTNLCRMDCAYCPHRAGAPKKVASFKPEELATTFLELNRRRWAEGLFLSSAIRGDAEATMTPMLKAVEMLRQKFDFHGYIHLKIMPGAPYDFIERAVELADRVSVNMEAPTPETLAQLSSLKDFSEGILQRMGWIDEAVKRTGRERVGQITQFVVGPAGETDHQLLARVSSLHREVKLRRAYFSAFHPVVGTPLEGEAPTPLLREHRLYQAEFLLRVYGFSLPDLVFGDDGKLPMEVDPKIALALSKPNWFPVEVNKASYEELLRVPGIGPKTARRLLVARHEARFFRLEELKRVGVIIKRAAPFVLVNGQREKSAVLSVGNFAAENASESEGPGFERFLPLLQKMALVHAKGGQLALAL